MSTRQEYMREWRSRNKERIKTTWDKWVEGKRDHLRASKQARYRRNPHLRKQQWDSWYIWTRETVFDFYGRVCVCCGETESRFLTIDHINGRSPSEKKANSASALYSSIVKSSLAGHPREDVRALCFNCNCGRERNGGICPHEESR